MVPAYRLNTQAIAFWALSLSLLLLPIGLGGARAIPFGLMQIGLGIFFACFAYTDHAHIFWPQRLKVALALFGIVLAWGFIQTLSITPDAWHHPLWAEAQGTLPGLKGSISLTPYSSLMSLQRLVTYALIGIAVYVLAKDPTTARRLVTMFWFVGFALCAAAMAQYILSINKVLWFKKWAYQDDLTGTFVNRNHFADYAGMTLLAGLALAWQSFRTFFRHVKPHLYADALQTWMVKRGLAFIFMLGIVMAALLKSHSRAGLVVTLAAIIVFVFSFLIYQRKFRTAIIVPACIGVVAIGLLMVMADTTSRFTMLFQDYSSIDRMKAYTITAGAVENNPWFGHGLDSFISAFRLYRDTTLAWGLFEFEQAHNDWLEALFDLGIPFGLMLFASLGLLISGLWHGIRTRHKDGLYPALGMGATAMVFAHALVDFNMQIPGVVATWLLLAGCGLAQSWSSRQLD